MNNLINIFIIYAREDAAFKNQLNNALAPLRRNGLVCQWHDDQILPGEKWEDRITENLSQADIVLALVSADFLASAYIQTTELKEAFKRHKKGETEIIPVIVRSCNWDIDPSLRELQALPKDGKPVNNWDPVDDAYYDIVQSINAKIVDLLDRRRKMEEARLAQEKLHLQDKEWERVNNVATVAAYREYILRFQPNLTHRDEAGNILSQMKEEIDYTIACLENTQGAYERYLRMYNKSTPRFDKEAQHRIKQALSGDTLDNQPRPGEPTQQAPPDSNPAWPTSLQKYWKPLIWALLVLVTMVIILYGCFNSGPTGSPPNEDGWAVAVSKNTKDAYEAYGIFYPNGQHIIEAGEKIRQIDREVKDLLKNANGRYNAGNKLGALQMIDEALVKDPDNPEAIRLKNQINQ